MLFCDCSAQTFLTWAKAISDAEVSHVCTDNSGNIYSTGTFRDTSQNPGSAIRKAFVAKYDPQGNLIWSRPFQSLYDSSVSWNVFSESFSVKTDENENIYIAGKFTQSLVFNTDTLFNKGLYDVFLVKFDRNGDYQWSKSFASAATDELLGDCLQVSKESVMLTGNFGKYYQGPGKPELTLDSFKLSAAGIVDVFFALLDTSGKVKWLQSLGAPGENSSGNFLNRIQTDAQQNIYLSGGFNNRAFFGAMEVTAPGSAFFLSKLDTNGNFIWVKTISGQTFVGPWTSTDASGNTYLTGTAMGTINFEGNPFTGSSFLAKYNASGDFLWVKELSPAFSFYSVYSLDAGVLLTGSFKNKFISGKDTLTSYGDYDALIIRLDTSGNETWAVHAGGIGEDAAQKLMPLNSNELLVQGYYNGPINSNAQNINFGNLQIPVNQSAGFFLAKLSFSTNLNDLEVNSAKTYLYPNPNSGRFFLDLKEEEYQSLSITDLTGKEIYRKKISPSEGSLIPLNLRLSNGMYLIRLSGKEKSSVRKFLVQQ